VSRGAHRVAGRILRTSHRLAPADDTGLRLFVRQARPEGPSRATVVLVHGATLASGLWDIAVPGYSLLEDLARAGFSVWAPDIRGYARSDRLARPTHAYAGLHEAVRDIAAVVDHACDSDGNGRSGQVLLAGGSWGSITAASYAVAHPRRVQALALLAPIFASPNRLWLDDLGDPADRTRLRTDLGPTRRVGRADLCRRWDPEIAGGDPTRRREDRVLDALLADALAAEPAVQALPDHDCSFCVPNGTLLDLFESFSGRPPYDPSTLRMPVLLVRGEDDLTSTAADVDALRARLTGGAVHCETLPDAGHFVCAERSAPRLHQVLFDFFSRQTASP
jgi:pimeloyl-ACP methyl ester carboxylesterase